MAESKKISKKIYVIVGTEVWPDGSWPGCYTTVKAAYDTLELAEARLPNNRYHISGRHVEFTIEEIELNTKWGSDILDDYNFDSENEN